MMSAKPLNAAGFMFSEKDVFQRGIYIPPFGKHGKHTFADTFTTGKPDVSRVFQYAEIGKHKKHKTYLLATSRTNPRLITKGMRR